MSCKIYTFPSFEREAKRLNKRSKSFKLDLKELMNELSSSPSLGADLGGGLRKVYILSKWQKIILTFSLLFKKK